jgi:hypothetical protein
MRNEVSMGAVGKWSRRANEISRLAMPREVLTLWGLVVGLFLATSAQGAGLIPFGSTWRYLLGTQEASSPTDAWRGIVFADAFWESGLAPIGYPSAGASGLEATIQTLLPTGSAAGYRCVFLRKTFVVTNLAEFVGLMVQVRYDDGFAAWLNGVPIGSANVAGPYTISILANDHEVTMSEALLTPSAGLLVAGNNVLAVQVFNSVEASSDLFLDVQMTSSLDEAPIVAAIDPPPTATLQSLAFINVVFTENVSGVDAADLLINSAPATNVLQISPREYQFNFPPPATGTVMVAWIPNSGINDIDGLPTAFVPGPSWSYTLDPGVVNDTAMISEFMADNESGIKDDDGTRSDWIEIYNPGPLTTSLEGWFLTDSRADLTKWRFPNVILGPNNYLLVWASEKNRSDSTRPLHTNFRLEKSGEFLALVDPSMNIVSAFDPAYPPQVANVSYGRERVDPNLVGYYIAPTPGTQNTTSGPGFASEPAFSVDSGVFTNNTITVTLSGPTEIRYTLDNSIPTNTSLLYTAPLTLGNNVVIKARAFQAGLWPSPVVSRAYHFLDATTRDFNSNLPLVILSTGGQPVAQHLAPGQLRTPASLVVVDTFRGRSSLVGKPDFLGLAEVEIYGQTSAGFPKQPYRFEIQDELRNDRRVPLLGLPVEADWRLRNPYSEKSLMNDFLTFELYEQMGHYATRRRFVELFVDRGGGKVTYPGDYVGVMLLIENIEAGPDKLNIQEVTSFHTTEPEISGGYVWKKEKDSPGDLNFNVGGGGVGTANTLKLHEPKPQSMRKTPYNGTAVTYNPNHSSITNYTPAATNQLNYLIRYLNAFITTLNASNLLTGTGTNHYSHYIDVDSFVDQHWIAEFTKNIDAYRLGNYMHKDRGGKIKMEPLWDWELSWGNADYLEGGRTNGWYYTQLGAADHIWLRQLMGGNNLPNSGGDPDFVQKLIDRWGELRTNALNGDKILARIDEIAALLSEGGADASPATRNFARYGNYLNTQIWPNPTGPPAWDVDYTQPTYAGIISEMKKWTLGRFLWVDGQFPKAPILELPEGDIPAGTSLAIAALAGTVYYTLDGTDPRLPRAAGAVSPTALTYTGPVILNGNARVFSRARVGNVWSPPAITTYVVRRPPVVISEIMYHPSPILPGGTEIDEEFEYIEVKNVGNSVLNLRGFALGGGVDFTFPELNLPAGQRVVVVKNQAAFISRYGAGSTIAGQYAGNLANEGERLVLRGRLREPILDFEYDDAWYPITDGFGYSLVIVDENAAAGSWSQASSWRPSGTLNGTPGQADGPAPVYPRVVINEALTHSDPPPPTDTVELLNLSGSPANVGGWFLTDDFRKPKKYRIPSATPPIPSGGFLIFDEADFNAGGAGFSFNSTGDELYLFSGDDAGELTGYVHGFTFGAQRRGVTFVRHVTSLGNERFVAASSPTLGTANAPPLVGPVVISEIMYRPPAVLANGNYWDNVEDEYIELRNISGSPVSLFDSSRPANTWKLGEAVEFVFPPDVVLPAGGHLLVVGFNPQTNPSQLETFRAKYGISPVVPIYGPYHSSLGNEVTVALYRADVPGTSEADDQIPDVLVDAVRYSNQTPWPVAADGAGHALHRLNVSNYGDDPVNWVAGGPTPGAAFVSGLNPTITMNPTNVSVGATATAILSGEGAGPEPLRYQWRHNDTALGGATNNTLVLSNVQPSQAGRYQLMVLNSFGSAVSAEALLTVLVPVKFLRHPANQIVTEGVSATFAVDAESFHPPLRYQWLRNGVPVANATNRSYVIHNAGESDDATTYIAALTDASGTFFSQEARLTVLIPPQLIDPVPRLEIAAVAGESVTLGVRFRGTRPIWLQWRKFMPNGQNQGVIRSGFINVFQDFLTIPSLSTNPFALNSAGFYAVQFTNIAGGDLGTGGTIRTNALVTVLADSNANGIPNDWEFQYFGSPTGAERDADNDGDTMSNWAEYVAGTHPQDPASFLKVDAIEVSATVSVRVGAISNRTYSVQYSDSLGANPWRKLADLTARSTNRVETVLDPASTASRYYRLVTPRQP